ncbi:MAG: hypothetical protein ACRDFS_00170 [Chloroflexota bacterium]
MAALAVIVLTALVIIGIGIAGAVSPRSPVGSIPTPPLTPLATVAPVASPSTTNARTKPVSTPAGTPLPTRSAAPNATKAALGKFGLQNIRPTSLLLSAAIDRNSAVRAHGHLLAYFSGHRSAYDGSPLIILNRLTGRRIELGRGDRLSPPVWSNDGRRLLYVQVRQVQRLSGERWTLMESDLLGRSRALISVNALNLTPLGWRHGHVVYLLALMTDTSVYQLGHHHGHVLAQISTAPITDALLSRDGRYIAFASPTNCNFCTLRVYDLPGLNGYQGQTGLPQETDLAWGAGDRLVADLGSSLALGTIDGKSTGFRTIPRPKHLPRDWPHPMLVALGARHIRLTDSVTDASYSASW